MKKLLIAITAALAALTMSIPAHAAGLAPTVTKVDNLKPAPGGGSEITVTGTNLDTVTSVTVDNDYSIVRSKTATTLVFRAPQHALGVATVLITNPSGKASFVVTYSPQRRPIVPSPKLPAYIKVGKSITVRGLDPAWAITVTIENPAAKVCTAKKNVIKALKKGSCGVKININPDGPNGSNPKWRGKIVVDSIPVK